VKRSLPSSLDQLGGMRAARWFRESTASQWDNFGPDAQREQQDRAIARYGLADSGLAWSVASSGWTSACSQSMSCSSSLFVKSFIFHHQHIITCKIRLFSLSK